MSHDHEQHSEKPPLTYLVNGEIEQTHAKELPAGVILEQAGFSPPGDYRLISLEPKKEYDVAADVVHLHEGQRFEALHRAPTPTS